MLSTDKNNSGFDFTAARLRQISLKAKLRSFLFDATTEDLLSFTGEDPLLKDWIYAYGLKYFHHIQEITVLEKAYQFIVQSTQELMSDYNIGLIDVAREGLMNFDLKIDNLVLLLQIVELRLQADSSQIPFVPLSEEDPPHTEEEFQELSQVVKNLDYLYKEQSIALSESQTSAQKKLEDYFSQAPIGICILKGKNFVVEVANAIYLELVDKGQDFIDKPLFDSLPELKDQAIKDLLEKVYISGIPFVGDEVGVYLVRNGIRTFAYFNFVYQPLREKDGSISGIIVVCSEVTSMMEAKLSLLEKEKEFRNMVAQSPIAMAIIKGREFIIEIANKSMEELWRKSLSEVEGKGILDVFPELREQKYAELLEGVMDTGIAHKASESLAYVDSHDGRKAFYLDFEYLPLFDANDNVYGIMCTVTDVTDRVKARQIKDISEKRNVHLIETLPVAMYTIDKNGYVDLYNEAAQTLWGRKPKIGADRWCGAFKISNLDGIIIPHEFCPMALAFKEGLALEEEIYMHRENGERRHVIVYPKPLFNEKGETIGASKVMIDITERVEVQEELRKSEEKFRLLTTSIPQFIWTSGPDGILNYFSDSVFEYSGITLETALNGGWINIVHPADREENALKWERSIKTGEPFKFEHRFRKADGKYRWQLSRALAQKDDKGNVLQWVGTSTDIHDQKRWQKNLEKIVNERTKELKKANIELENMNKELSSFAYISSHDLQEPLRKIQTFAGIILDSDSDNLSETGKRNFSRMQLAANRMKTLINDLLTYSRTNASEKVYVQTDLNLIFSEIHSEFLETLEEKNGLLEISKMPTISAIPFQLRQLFMNLISNAIKFSRADVAPHIKITSEIIRGNKIESTKTFGDQNYLHVTVADNGIGFSQEYSAKIFEVFQRLHGKSDYEGTGIGLAICNKIAENHHAVIRAESVLGEGAQFHIYFPIEQ